MRKKTTWAAGEPALADLLNDPLTRAVMARDGVSDDELLETIRRARLVLRWRSQGRDDRMDNAA
jgi:hypothetical protein